MAHLFKTIQLEDTADLVIIVNDLWPVLEGTTAATLIATFHVYVYIIRAFPSIRG